MLGAQDDGLGAPCVPLGEGLWPVGLEGGDEAVAERVALVLHRELEPAEDEDGGVGVEPFVRGPAGEVGTHEGSCEQCGEVLRKQRSEDSQRIVEHGEEARQLLSAVRHLYIHNAVVRLRNLGPRALHEEWWDREHVCQDGGVAGEDRLVNAEVLQLAILGTAGEDDIAVVVVEGRMSLAARLFGR